MGILEKKQEHVLRLGNHRDSLINSSEKLIHKTASTLDLMTLLHTIN